MKSYASKKRLYKQIVWDKNTNEFIMKTLLVDTRREIAVEQGFVRLDGAMHKFARENSGRDTSWKF